MARPSVLTNKEKDSIQIDHFIFHIILEDEEEPILLDKVTLTDKQVDFFKKRFKDAAEGSQYVFQDMNLSTPSNCALILNDPDENFVKLSKLLAIDFKGRHKTQMSDGVFICALINIEKDDDVIPLVSMIKMDHSRVLRYKLAETKAGKEAIVEEVLNSFVEDKAAMQKVALVDIGDHFKWGALARERNKTVGIADYFEGFLGVTLAGDPGKLTKSAILAVKRWSNQLDDSEVPAGQVKDDYKARAFNYMDSHSSFDTNEFVNMVIKDEDEERKKRHSEALHEVLAKEGIAGQTFRPRADSLEPKEKKNKRRTTRGVTIEWTGEAKAAGIDIPEKPNENGMYEIKILTKEKIT